MKSPQILLERIGRRLYGLRTSHDETQAELARATGLTTSTISNYESGKRDASVGTLIDLARHFGVRLSDIVTEKDWD